MALLVLSLSPLLLLQYAHDIIVHVPVDVDLLR